MRFAGHLVSIISLALTAFSAAAQDEMSLMPHTSAEPPVAGVVEPRYSGPRIGDIAPSFTLPDAKGKLWASRDQLGQRALLLILVGESPVLIGKNVTPQSVVKSVVEAAQHLEAQKVATVVVSKASGISLTDIDSQFDRLILRDDKGDLHRFFAPGPTSLTLVAIDRAGFLRHMETASATAPIGALMRQVGDCTPLLEVGRPAPDFAISDMHGRVRRLSDWRGRKNVLLTFFPKCFTGGCANQLTSLRDEFASLPNDTEILGVSVDPAEGERGQLAFASALDLPFALVPDTGRNLSLLYGAARRSYSLAWRRTVLIDKDGIVRLMDKQVNVYTHGPDTLAKMRELKMAK